MKNMFKNLMNRQCDAEAAKTINDFQKCELNGARITTAQMEQMAKTGKITKNDGTTVSVPIDVQQSAQRFMADGGRLFKTMESATDGRHDGQLGAGDYRQALRKDWIDDDLF